MGLSKLVERILARKPIYKKRRDYEYQIEVEWLRRDIREYEMKKVAGNPKIVQDMFEELIESIEKTKNLHGGDRYEFFYQRFSVAVEDT